ncbi:hypothetical protein [Pleionea sediminis]|uniref:hypothetical protein n=1 Tax=Pleionea sediminis TaxID=2569479 RepID=UPI001184CFC1|nr:hypothetical protein [Pleionea sediminis]
MKFTISFHITLLAFSLLVTACQSKNNGDSQAIVESTHLPNIKCPAPVQVENIWVLEPMLEQNGKITEDMSPSEREQAIREYIQLKNSQFEKCKKGTK